jgi:hypothetical protein
LFGHNGYTQTQFIYDDCTQTTGLTQEGITNASTAAMAVTLATTEGKRVSHWTANFDKKEDKILCVAWRDISQDPLTGAEQKGPAYWGRVHSYYHEHRMFDTPDVGPPFFSDRNELSLMRRWSVIHQECSKFQAAWEHAKANPASGHVAQDMV